ncbi:uncharacterized protein LOC124898840 [Capsicum annuum]|uniref:uncharacterized protein LOC124898840 n=1 Tax=Capsicum annuum TaxID=4072 RepID=UPI001FB0B7C4|nr:uncharacterized protein LOC124898840 [Capsicum annuum]
MEDQKEADRSGKILLVPSVGNNGVEDVIEVDDEPEEECPVKSGKLDGSDDTSKQGKEKEKEVVVSTILKPPPPFPQWLKNKMNDENFRKFMAILKQLTVNVPLVEALEQIPGYAKFMKDLVMKKRVVRYEPMDNLHHCSAISTRSLLQKKADPRAFTILCTVRSLNFVKALCDLGASINLMSLSMYKNLGSGDPTPINIRLVMADRSIKWPVVILDDVLVKVADVILLTNFVVLDSEVDFEVPIILGRSFLATGRVVVDMELHELKFRFNDKKAKFKMHSYMTQQKDMSVFSIVDVS